MSAIDDPLGQTTDQNRDDGSAVSLSLPLNVAPVLLGLLQNPHAAPVAALTTVLAFVHDFRDNRRNAARAEALADGFRAGLGELGDRIDILEKRAFGPDAEDAVAKAIQQASNTARLEKIRMFGLVLGGTLKQDSPRWQEAAEFIRDVEQFTEVDVLALKLLWRHQRVAFDADTNPNERRTMSRRPGDFTSSWGKVLADAAAHGISADDWEARCGRLVGFGLAAPLAPPNPRVSVSPSTEDVCFRLTSRAVRLLELLMEQRLYPKRYPKVLYHPTLGNKTVQDEDDHQRAGQGWYESPNEFPETNS
jgi:hypothetical protein